MAQTAVELDIEKEGTPHNVYPVDDVRAGYTPGTPEEKRLVRKLDFRILPILWIMYVCNTIDRSNIGNAKVGGMAADLKLSSSDYSLILSIFFVGYLLLEVPSNMLLSRSKPSIFLPGLMFAWGALQLAIKGINSLGGLVAFRLVLGMLEAGFYPGVMFLLSCWYTPREISKRVALWYSAQYMAGAFSGILAGILIDNLDGVGNTRGWKWLFIIEGLITVVLSALAFFLLPNYPQTTSWLSDEERKLAIARLIFEEDEDLEQITHRQAFVAVIKDPKVWAFMVVDSVFASFGTVSYFYPTLTTALGYTGRSAQFMTVPIYATILVAAYAMGYNADRTGQKAFHVMASCSFGICAFIVVLAVSNNTVKYVFMCLGSAGIWSVYPVSISWIVIMFEGRERRAVSIALINGVANLSAIYGSFFWPSKDAPKYVMGFSITIAFMAVAVIGAGLLKWKYGDKGVGKYANRQVRH